MQIKIKYFSVLLMLFLLFSACEKNVEIDIDKISPMIVVNGVLTADEDAHIFLSRTRHILDNAEITALADATVTITDEQNRTDTLRYGESKVYSSGDMELLPGKSYTITANAADFNRATATAVIPEKVNILQIDTISTVNEWGEKIIDFEMTFRDPEGVLNYYMISLRSNYQSAWEQESYYFDTLYVDSEKDTVVTGYRREVVENKEIMNEHIWFESENLAIEQQDSYQNRILFSDKLFDGKKYSIRGRFYPWFLNNASDSATIYFSLHSIDEHYYKYINTRVDHYYAKNDPFAVPVVVHNNISDGIGILGGMSVYTDSVKIAPREQEWNEPRF